MACYHKNPRVSSVSIRKVVPKSEYAVYDAEQVESCPTLSDRVFEAIIAADVLEHVSNAGSFLGAIKTVMNAKSRLILTTPCAFSIKRMVPLAFFGYERVHPDHVAYYSLSTLTRILSRFGLKIESTVMFQWKNPTVKNAFVNALFAPANWLTGGRLCDEIGIIASSRCG